VKRLLLLAPFVVMAAACGGSGSDSAKLDTVPVQQAGPVGSGPDMVWFYRAEGKPRSLVIFLHGYGGAREETPVNHVAWLKHLARNGSDVIYPRYERGGLPDPFPHLGAGVKAALSRLGNPKLPVVVIGYSRGGRIAVDYAAIQAARGHEPRAVLAVFPGLNSIFERLGPLDKLDAKTRIVMMVGDRDIGVGGAGARAILARLQQARFPPNRITVLPVRSTKTFSATHMSVLETTPGAQKAFWLPADELIDSVR
jgi:pimeloyl-ACP methyl ester carboxylesterase